jgi:hypothetical protein
VDDHQLQYTFGSYFHFHPRIDKRNSVPFLIPEKRFKFKALIPQPVIGGNNAANEARSDKKYNQ